MTVQPDNKTITGTKSSTKRVVIEKDQDEQQAIGLLENAVDFFKRAMSAIDSDPKESIINFYTAVELILKFPLMLEHWSLIVTGKPIKKDYLKGDFQSPTFKETCERLEGVFDVTMDSETKSILDSVRKHRNTMVHYYHHNLNENKGAKELTEEQARAWFKLNSFLKTNSKKLNIEPYQQELDILEKELFAYSQYAEQKYISLKPKIEGLEKRSEKFAIEIKEQNDEIKTKNEVINHAKTLIDKYKSQQDTVRNNKEFESLDKEIEFQELEIQLSEKRIKEFDAKIAHKNETFEELNNKIAELKNHLKFKKEELENLVSETQKEEDFLLEKSAEFAKNIDERLLASYQRIRTNSPTGLAVVGLERGAPKGSFFTLPPQKQMEIAQRKKIIIDEHSGKILVDDDMVNEENEKMKEIIKF